MSDVMTVGLHIVDILGRPVQRIPDGQDLDVIDEIRVTVAGTAAATAVDLARLGHSVSTVGAVGRDALGTFLRTLMEQEGIDCDGLTEVDEVQTASTILPIRPDGSRPALHVPGASALLTEDMIPWDQAEKAKVMHIGGTGLLRALDGEPTARILRRAKECGLITTMDLLIGEDPDLSEKLALALPYVDYVLPNDTDSLMVTGADSLDSAIGWFHEHGARTAVVTLGADGARVCPRGEEPTVVPAYPVDVVDTTGCGDAFTGGFISGLLEGAPLLDAAAMGCAAGSMVATGLGSQGGLTSRTAFDEFLASASHGGDA